MAVEIGFEPIKLQLQRLVTLPICLLDYMAESRESESQPLRVAFLSREARCLIGLLSIWQSELDSNQRIFSFRARCLTSLAI